MTAERIVVTGLGATTPLGGTAPATWDALLAGTSGARALEHDWVAQYELTTTFAATVVADPEDVLGRVQCRRLDPASQYALVAAREAWSDAGLAEGDIEPERLGVAVGTGIGGVTTLLGQWDTMLEKGARRVSPLTIPMLMPNAPSATVSLDLGARAGAHTMVSACASGAESIGYGMDLIRRGVADVVVAGGCEASIHPLPLAAFGQMQALSRRNDDPARASRPWDVDRDGFLLGEGAACVVLERESSARARGARVYAVLAGHGASADAHHITAGEPDGRDASRAMLQAVEDGDLCPGDIVTVNAHGTSTPVGDVAEARAIHRAFGEHAASLAVTSTKSMTGHLLGAAGALETVITALTLHHRLVPATINIETLDPEVDLDIVRGEHRALGQGDLAAVNNSFGFGGANVALTLRTA